MSKKIVAMLMAVAMAFSLLPVTAFAVGEENGQAPVTKKASENNLTMNKTVTPEGDGTYTVQLESYATGEVTNTTTTKPRDIVLLLDVSGSMDQAFTPDSSEYRAVYDGSLDTGKQYYIQRHGWYYEVSYCNICNKWTRGCYDWFGYHVEGREFIPRTAENDNYDAHTQFYEYVYTNGQSKLDALKTAVNKFIDDIAINSPQSNISIVKFAGKTTKSIGNETYGRGNNKENYTQIVKGLTKVGDGGDNQLKQEVSQLTAAGATSSDYGLQKAQKALENATKDKVVVLFTDGEPNHSNGFDYKVATTAVNTAKTLKQNNTTIYTVGVFKNPDNDINLYMSSVSSNYPKASATATNNGKNWAVTNGGSKVGEHYINAENAADLIKAFQTISSEVSSTHLNGSAVVVDKVPRNFKAPASAENVTLKVANYKADGTFDTATDAPDEIRASVNGNGTVSVTGFDFSKNWCGLEGTKPHGKKLIIEFTIERTNYGGTQPTNAGAYIKAKADDEKEIIKLADPQVPVTIELNKTLEVNEEKYYDGEGFAILTKIAAQANTLVDGINNAYVDMELTVKVDDTTGETTYTYKIPAGEKTGSWYEGDSKKPMDSGAIGNVKTSKDVKRSTSNEVDVYTYNFDLTLSDADTTSNGAKSKKYQNNNASFKIIPRDVRVTAKDKSVVAGQPAPTYEADVTGTINSDTVDYTISCDYAPATSTEGTIPIVLTGAPTQGNYNVTYQNGTLTVKKAPVTTGTLKVTKEVQGENLTLESLPRDFKITVTGTGRNSTYSQELTLATKDTDESTSTATWTISDLPAGEYTVSESNADVKDYTYTTTYNNVAATQDNSATVTVKKGEPSTMTVTNTYTENAKVNLSQLSWTATVSGDVTYYVNYTVKEADIPKGKIVNTIVMKNGDEEKTANSDPVSTWDTKQLKSATKLDTSDWTTTVTLTLPTVNGNKEGTPVITGDGEQKPEVKPIIAISKGSYVIDQIGNEFTFMDGLSLEVNDTKLLVTKDKTTENCYHFGTQDGQGAYPYTVTYTPATAQFKWEINQDIPAGTKVTLSYKLKLANPKTGTYGVKDLDGDGIVDDTNAAFTENDKKNALYTNKSAALYKDDKTKLADFPMPSVSYTVSSGSSGSHSGGSRPSLNTKDHYGYIIGYPVDYYTGQPTTDQTKKPVRPEGKITRAEVATIYFRMLTDESRTKFWSQSNSYSDVKAGDWFNNAVSTLSKAGIIAGYEDGSFRPNGYITRAEFATIAARFFDVTYNGKDLFPDISGHWAKDYINQAANKGFVNGYEDGTFKPDRNITRAEAVTLVNRTLDRHPDKNHFTKDMLVWPDNMDQTKWYYADMQEATNSHTYQMKENSDKTKYENWTKTLPIRNWEALEKAWSNANSSQGNGNVV